MVYIVFSCEGNPTDATKCTTRWDSDISCTIPISGMIDGIYYNLMIMDGDEAKINKWVNENTGKVQIITKEQANQLGQTLVPPGTEIVRDDDLEGESVTYVAGEFDVDNPDQLWTKKGQEQKDETEE